MFIHHFTTNKDFWVKSDRIKNVISLQVYTNQLDFIWDALKMARFFKKHQNNVKIGMHNVQSLI